MHLDLPNNRSLQRLDKSKRTLDVGNSLRYFGDGFQKKAMYGGRKCWKIPVMEGNFFVENGFGAMEAVAGGNFMIFAKDQPSGL